MATTGTETEILVETNHYMNSIVRL